MRNEKFTCSIVLYKNDLKTLNETVKSVINSNGFSHLYLIDNSPTKILEQHFIKTNITYIFIGKNLGFGKGHNLILNKIKDYNYHLVLNPDVFFKSQVIENLIQVLSGNDQTALIVPKVLYPDNTFQISCRKYPRLLDFTLRSLKVSTKSYYSKEELSKPLYVDFVHGCFMLFKTKELIKIKGFDERYFMYVEDIDICKKIDMINKKKLYFPLEFIYHGFEKGSSKKIKLLFYHIKSIFQYFYKWKIAN